MKTVSRRAILAGSAAIAAMAGSPTILRAQAKTVRWGEALPANHPQVQMAEKIAADVKAKTGGKIEIQVFPNSQLGTGPDMIEAVSSGALQMTTDGAGAIGSFLPALSVIEAPYLWRDAAHMAKMVQASQFGSFNDALIQRRKMRILGVSYYGKRHLTTGNKAVRTPADMVGFKLRVPPVDTFRAMAEAWGARATPIAYAELYLALSQGAVDGQENPLPTIQSGKFFEVQKFLVLTEHIITPRMPLINEPFWQGLQKTERDAIAEAIAAGVKWQDAELLRQEAGAVAQLRQQGMTVIEPDVPAFRKAVLDTVPKKFEEKWGKGTWEAFLKL
ncbi:MAG: sialic acid TRAP transporter substrate-binding protein SiaP [Rhodospirillales bacterium]|nr:sialic acid TRAP transporter substrate-binding protein SiaP [Rhodospirillales bacterium]